MAYDITIDAAPATTTCPKCSGTGRCRTALPGGWLIRPCGPCSGSGLVAAAPCCGAAAEPCRGCRDDVPPGVRERDDADARRAVCELRADYLCDRPDDVPDDEPYIPSPEDEADYLSWCRERQGRIRAERIEADGPGPRTFLETIYDVANDLCEDLDPHKVFIGEWVAKHLAEPVRFFEAKGPEQFLDRRDACLDAARWAAEARAVTGEGPP